MMIFGWLDAVTGLQVWLTVVDGVGGCGGYTCDQEESIAQGEKEREREEGEGGVIVVVVVLMMMWW